MKEQEIEGLLKLQGESHLCPKCAEASSPNDANHRQGQGGPYGESKVSDLRKIPGVGANMERHLWNIGIHCIADLKGRDPEKLYHLDCLKKGYQDDRCVLYVFRCAVYFADHEQHNPEKLKWWYWKDREYPEKD